MSYTRLAVPIAAHCGSVIGESYYAEPTAAAAAAAVYAAAHRID